MNKGIKDSRTLLLGGTGIIASVIAGSLLTMLAGCGSSVTTALASTPGQLFCKVATITGSVDVAVADATVSAAISSAGGAAFVPAAVSVIGAAASDVAADCAKAAASVTGATGATPEAPPATSATVTTVAIAPVGTTSNSK